MRRFYFSILALAFALSLGGGFASTTQQAVAKTTQCRDAKGKFTKCKPAMVATAKPKRCRDKMGKFTKCKM